VFEWEHKHNRIYSIKLKTDVQNFKKFYSSANNIFFDYKNRPENSV